MCTFIQADRSPTEGTLEVQLAMIKVKTKVDKRDRRVFLLFEKLYQEVLQSETIPVSYENTMKLFQTYLNDTKIPNTQLLFLFAYYQEYISNTSAIGKPANPKIQMSIMGHMLHELEKSYDGEIPAIIAIYSAEAAMSDKRYGLAGSLLEKLLKEVPDSIPAKVYLSELLNDKTRAKELRNDLIKNHANHWMVKQYKIK